MKELSVSAAPRREILGGQAENSNAFRWKWTTTNVPRRSIRLEVAVEPGVSGILGLQRPIAKGPRALIITGDSQRTFFGTEASAATYDSASLGPPVGMPFSSEAFPWVFGPLLALPL